VKGFTMLRRSVYTGTVNIRFRYTRTFGTDFRLGKGSGLTMKIYLPSGYKSWLSDNVYYQPGVHDESEIPAKVVDYLIKEKFACYILEELADKLNELQTENARFRETLEDISTGGWNTSDDSIICMMDAAGAALHPKKSEQG
jgi:hypothetical protein